jgi:hypothetical protein
VSNWYHHRKDIVIDVLNSMKVGCLCEYKDLDVINAKVCAHLCKISKV